VQDRCNVIGPRMQETERRGNHRRPLGCVGADGDSTIAMTDVADGRYLVESGTDLVNYTTMGGLTVVGFDASDEATAAPVSDAPRLPGNPYPDAQSCRVARDGAATGACWSR